MSWAYGTSNSRASDAPRDTFGLFAQDTWRVTRRVTMNYGLRYDNFGNPYPTAGTPLANFHLGSGSTMAEQVANGINKQQKHVYNQDMNWIFSPRAGVAWDVTGSGSGWCAVAMASIATG